MGARGARRAPTLGRRHTTTSSETYHRAPTFQNSNTVQPLEPGHAGYWEISDAPIVEIPDSGFQCGIVSKSPFSVYM